MTEVDAANISFRSNSWDCMFQMFIMPIKQSINEQKHAVSAASGGPYANRTLPTVELWTWAASRTFIFE